MRQRPLVSVVIPVYNGANYLREAIESVLTQSYPNVEVLVINDGSQDGGATERIARSFGSRIRYFQKANGGVATALNLGIDEMRGEYFSWLSHDDMYMPEKIERQVAAVLPHGGWAVAYCNFRTISASGAPITTVLVSPKGLHAMRCLLAIGQEGGIHGCALLIPRIIFERYGRFDPALLCTQDYDVWFRFAGNVPFVHLEETLLVSRQHAEQGGKKRLVLCTRERDRLHSRLIGELSDDELDAYCERSVAFLVNAYHNYRNVGCEKTSLRLLKHVCRLARARNEADKAVLLVNEALALGDNPESAWRFWEDTYLPLVSGRKDNPRILAFNNVWFRGGIERVVATVLTGLKTKYSWVVVSSGTELDGGFPLDDEAARLRIRSTAAVPMASRIAAICALLDVDLFIGHPNIVFDFLGVYELLEGIGVKSIACNHAHYFLPYHYPHLFPVIGRRVEAFKHANAVTWPTSFGASIYGQLAENSAHIPNPNPLVGPRELAAPTRKVVLSVGRFNDAVKRLDRTLEVFARVLLTHPDAELVLVGGCSLDQQIPASSTESVRQALGRLRISRDRIRFVGETADVETHYAGAALLMMTSDSEGLPLALIEAGTFGLPSVHFDIPGLEDLISDGENGFVLPQDDLDAMAARICELLSDPELRRRMGQRAQELARRFDQARVCRRWEDFIELVLTSKNQETLNQELGRRFRDHAEDSATLTRRAIGEYERNVALLLETGLESTGSPKTPYSFRSLTRRVICSLRNEGLGPTARKVAARVGRLRN